MPKQTLLDITQDILNDMESDEVNSIDDTVESQQVAQIIKTTFFEIISSREWPHLSRTMQVSPQGGVRPTTFDISEGYTEIKWIKYNVMDENATDDNYVDVAWISPKEFLDHLATRKSSDSSITSTTGENGLTLLIKNDAAPTYWTSFDDETIIMDSYNSAVDGNLQASKTQCWGQVEPTWAHTDAGIPDLPAKAFAYLISEAKSTAFNALRQVGNQKEEQRSRRQRIYLSRQSRKVGHSISFPDYGRK